VLLAPLAGGSTVISLSSGAALRGSPLSGGCAGAKAAIRWLTGYAAEESERAGLGIRFVSLLPQLTPGTGLGAWYVTAYAARQGGPAAPAASGPAGPRLTPDLAGQAVTELAADPAYREHACVLTAGGLRLLV
jgi:hypothetical protein